MVFVGWLVGLLVGWSVGGKFPNQTTTGAYCAPALVFNTFITFNTFEISFGPVIFGISGTVVF